MGGGLQGEGRIMNLRNILRAVATAALVLAPLSEGRTGTIERVALADMLSGSAALKAASP